MGSSITYLSCTTETQAAVETFLAEWSNGKELFTVQTSGSTGKPKSIVLRRNQLESSARRTLRYFDLKPGATALMGISPATIGGKMMLVRALLGDLHLFITEPSANPLAELDKAISIDFAPLVPLQLKTLVQFPERLGQIRTVLLGGAPLALALEEQIAALHPRIFIGFGMTETVSHIAIRMAGNPVYKALEGVTFAQNEDALVITDQLLGIENLQTNDSVRLHDSQHFEWLGRTDFAINSGGIKIHPEQVEQVLATVLDGPFFVTGRPDATFGEQCIIVADETEKQTDLSRLQVLCAEKLGKYAIPKAIIHLPMIYTAGGKINRKATLAQSVE